MRHISLILALAALPTSLLAAPGTISVATGVSGTHSSQFMVSDPSYGVVAEARVLAHGPNLAFIVELGQRREANATVQVTRAMQGSAELDFDPAWRSEPFCSGNGHCDGARVGTIFFSQAAFEIAAQHGISATLNSSEGRIAVTLPAQLFAEARGRAVWLD